MGTVTRGSYRGTSTPPEARGDMLINTGRRLRATIAVMVSLGALLWVAEPSIARASSTPLLGEIASGLLLIAFAWLFLGSTLAALIYRLAYDRVLDGFEGFPDTNLKRRSGVSFNRAGRDAAIRLIRRERNRVRKKGDSLDIIPPSIDDVFVEVLYSNVEESGGRPTLSTDLLAIESDSTAAAVLRGVQVSVEGSFDHSHVSRMMGPRSEVFERAIAFLETDYGYHWSGAWLDAPWFIRTPITKGQLAVLRFWPYNSFEQYAESRGFARRFCSKVGARSP